MNKMKILIIIQIAILFLTGCTTPDDVNIVNNTTQNDTNNSILNNTSGIVVGNNMSVVLTAIRRGNCTDSDDGIDYDMRGITTSGRLRKMDKCQDDRTVIEYSCNGDGTIHTTIQECDGGCADGTCNSAPTCTETDDGKDYGTKGITRSTSGTSTILDEESDSCTGSYMLLEKYCKSDKSIGTEVHTCDYGCTNGKCNAEPETSCSDSDDNGGSIDTSSYYEKGTVTNHLTTLTDYCNSTITLYERYCETPDEIGTEAHLCTYGCTNGKCNSAPATTTICIDSDDLTPGAVSSDSYYEKGTTTLTGSITKDDWCNPTTGEVTEWYCPTSSTRTSIIYDCPNECLAANDYCNSAPITITCSDSDGGQDFDEYGTVTYTSGGTTTSYHDFCYTFGEEVKEYYCDGNEVRDISHVCSECSGGRCISAPSPSPDPTTPSSDYSTDSVVYFNSPTGGRKILIINDLPSYVVSGNEMNDIVSLGIGQTETTYEVLESDTNLALPGDMIDHNLTMRTVNPTTLTSSGSPYRYFTIPDWYTTPYYIDIYYGRWDPSGYRFVKMFSYVDDCSGDAVVKKATYLDVNEHPTGKVLAIKMSGFVPEGNLYGSEFCD